MLLKFGMLGTCQIWHVGDVSHRSIDAESGFNPPTYYLRNGVPFLVILSFCSNRTAKK
jgi:hypothetical protein